MGYDNGDADGVWWWAHMQKAAPSHSEHSCIMCVLCPLMFFQVGT